MIKILQEFKVHNLGMDLGEQHPYPHLNPDFYANSPDLQFPKPNY